MKSVEGVKKPRVESNEEIIAWQEKHHLNGYSSYRTTADWYGDNMPYLFVQMTLFNKYGKFVPLADNPSQKYCNQPDGPSHRLSEVSPSKELVYVKQYMDRFDRDSIEFASGLRKNIPINQLDETLADILSTSEILNNSSNPFLGEEEFDYFLVIGWSKFLGKKDQLKQIYRINEIAKNNQHAKFRIIYVNFDLNSAWTPEQIDFVRNNFHFGL